MLPPLLAVAVAAGVARAEPTTGAAPDDGLGGAATIRGDEAPGVVAFTFDDGPKPGPTDAVLDALQAYDVPGAFFLVGRRLAGKRGQAPRELVARMLAQGHLVGNHTWSHQRLPDVDDATAAAELDRASAAIRRATGSRPTLFRPPFGAHSAASTRHAASGRLTTVLWSIDSLDWKRPSADRMRAAVVDAIVAENGGVVLMHDTKQLTADTLPGILDDLEARNCARLAAGQPAIVPVSLHYFARDRRAPRPVPPEVEARTQRYRDGLPARCAARAARP
jgi:peptidoglycan/xylan/chitin deacetylase (PgdA/CDA1 family)